MFIGKKCWEIKPRFRIFFLNIFKCFSFLAMYFDTQISSSFRTWLKNILKAALFIILCYVKHFIIKQTEDLYFLFNFYIDYIDFFPLKMYHWNCYSFFFVGKNRNSTRIGFIYDKISDDVNCWHLGRLLGWKQKDLHGMGWVF